MYNICTIIYSLDQKAETTRTCQTSKGRTATHSLEMSTRYTTRQDMRYCSSKGRTAAHSIESRDEHAVHHSSAGVFKNILVIIYIDGIVTQGFKNVILKG